MLPLVPSEADPVRTDIAPELPELAVPVFMLRWPLVPAVDDRTVEILNDPLDVSAPKPDTNETDPPVALVLSPALMESLPPRA